jgi:hypothetical protein
MISGCNGKTVMSTFFRQFVLSVNRNLTIYSSNAQLQITYTLIKICNHICSEYHLRCIFKRHNEFPNCNNNNKIIKQQFRSNLKNPD